MKFSKQLILLLVFLTCGTIANAQTKTDKITKELTFPRKSAINVVQVENIFGSVVVETHDSDKVLFEVERIIRSKNEEGFRKAEELTLEFASEGDSIIGYFNAPYITRRSDSYKSRSVNINESLGYSFTYNFKVKVPQNTSLSIHTVNNGELKVSNLTANQIKASNVNGSIVLDNVAADVAARTVNGHVLVTYKENPKGKSQMETINGNVELLYKKDLSAIINFSTFNGAFYTDLNDLEKLPVKVEKTQSENGSTTKYKIDKGSSFKTGGGAASFDLKSFNGKVIVKSAS